MATAPATTNQTGISSKTLFEGVGNLIKLLPTGTVFVFQFLNPVLTNNGSCSAVNKSLNAVLIALCGLACLFSSFTDSYTGTDNKTHYGIVTPAGLWPAPSSDGLDLRSQRLRVGDFAHGLLSLTVFAALALLDTNTVRCFYPDFESEQKVLLQVLVPVIGGFSSSVFALFPSDRHGIGYRPSS
ncbi:hypothetical protein PanWU01x14_006880 [Parasponia andersonii]|uniref:Uncharacterized protein n=1 Tax=Parasponia andersonii TaxID=3476 RepID=A0A2P5E3W9_PARAD|nr:hypothetical protein PanWU01x14_006880 [Parasponia andersonii]